MPAPTTALRLMENCWLKTKHHDPSIQTISDVSTFWCFSAYFRFQNSISYEERFICKISSYVKVIVTQTQKYLGCTGHFFADLQFPNQFCFPAMVSRPIPACSAQYENLLCTVCIIDFIEFSLTFRWKRNVFVFWLWTELWPMIWTVVLDLDSVRMSQHVEYLEQGRLVEKLLSRHMHARMHARTQTHTHTHTHTQPTALHDQ